jgi:hypothetical protein
VIFRELEKRDTENSVEVPFYRGLVASGAIDDINCRGSMTCHIGGVILVVMTHVDEGPYV